MENVPTKEEEVLKFNTKLSFYFILLGIIGFVILSLPFLLDLENADKYGYIGDTIGGILNPLVAIGAGLLTFMAFLIQYEANKQVHNQFKVQQFESQFFEMLRLHKENINEMKIAGYEASKEISVTRNTVAEIINFTETTSTGIKVTEGRKVFVTMTTELVACYEILLYFNSIWNLNYTPDIILKLAYDFFFFGSKSEVVSSKYISSSEIENFRIELNKIRDAHKDSIGRINLFTGVLGTNIKLYIKYYPFSGHENRLGHYYRHLYSTVKYVVENEQKKLFDYRKAREYLKILRSQMSNDEQLMLYYNYQIGYGRDWFDYLTKYRMLHNLPINKVKYAANPRTHFRQFILAIKSGYSEVGHGELFEWGDEEK